MALTVFDIEKRFYNPCCYNFKDLIKLVLIAFSSFKLPSLENSIIASDEFLIRVWGIGKEDKKCLDDHEYTQYQSLLY